MADQLRDANAAASAGPAQSRAGAYGAAPGQPSSGWPPPLPSAAAGYGAHHNPYSSYAHHFSGLANSYDGAGRVSGGAAAAAPSPYFPNQTHASSAFPPAGAYARPLPAHLNSVSAPSPAPASSYPAASSYAYSGYPQQVPSAAAKESAQARPLSNGHLSGHAPSTFPIASASSPAVPSQPPQQYGNPKEFVDLSRSGLADPKSGAASVSYPYQHQHLHQHQQHHPVPSSTNAAAPTPYGNGGYPSNPYTGLNSNFGSATPGANGNNGYDAIAAQILNSFGGSQLSPSLIHPDLAKAQQQPQQQKLPDRDVEYHPPALNLSRPSSPRNSNNNNDRSSLTAALSSEVDRKDPPSNHTVPSAPVVDLSAPSSLPPPPQPAASEPPPKSIHRLPFNPAAVTAAASRPSSSILLGALSREPLNKRRLSADSPKMKLKRLREEGSASSKPSSPSSQLAEGGREDDPYSFDNEERESTIQLTKFGAAAAGKDCGPASSRAGGGGAGPVYKFKSALLSRESRTNSTESRGSNASNGSAFKPTAFEHDHGAFLSACEAFLEDLNGKSVAVSLRPSMETYRDRLAARREKNANRGRKRKVVAAEEGEEANGDASHLDVSGDHDLEDEAEDDEAAAGGDKKAVASDDEEAPLRPPTNKPQSSEAPAKKSKKSESPKKSKDVTQLSDSPKKSAGRKRKRSESKASEPRVGDGGDKVSNGQVPPSADSSNAPSLANGNSNSGNSSNTNSGKSSSSKKGQLWALPIVPKPPQKPDKSKAAILQQAGQQPVLSSSGASPAANGKSTANVIRPRIVKKEVDLSEVWRQAFGANKKPGGGGATEAASADVKADALKAEAGGAGGADSKVKTFLRAPPELRRREKPAYGGLIHFAPDWEQRVRRHHHRCRLPDKLARGMMAKPKILKYSSSSATSSPIKEKFEQAHPLSPEERSGGTAAHHSALHGQQQQSEAGPSKKPVLPLLGDEGSGDAPSSAVDAILEKRRMRHRMGQRIYKQPGPRKDKSVAFDRLPEEGLGLMLTPGLPALTSETTQELLMSSSGDAGGFGSFRRQTLLRYLECLEDSAELKAHVLDWKPEVLDSKTRRQASRVRTAASYREVFGLDLDAARSAREEAEALALVAAAAAEEEQEDEEPAERQLAEETVVEPSSSAGETPATPKTPSKKKKYKSKKAKEKQQQQQVEESPKDPGMSESPKDVGASESSKEETPVKPKRKYTKKKKKEEAAPPRSPTPPPPPQPPVVEEIDESEYVPNEKEEELQTSLQGFALDLLDDNLSWSSRKVIQNLVIWEPVEPEPGSVPLQLPAPSSSHKYKKKAKKYKKRQSGLDFSAKKKSSKGRDCSRAASEERGADEGPPRVVTHSLENVDTECRELVVDKGAGETILHRAAKMGYPDVTAYALDVLGMAPTVKDNAGVGPVHKAAFRGNASVLDVLLRFGVDPNTNVKGTRPLHEALESGSAPTVRCLLAHGADPLLYDYSGNMPIDLTEGDAAMRRYLSAVLADLHGRDAERWSVDHDPAYHRPPVALDEPGEARDDDEDDVDEFAFEMTSSHPMPPFFKFPDRPGQYVVLSDLRQHKSATENRMKHVAPFAMSREEFARTARCTLLGYNGSHHHPHRGSTEEAADAGKREVSLVLVDVNVKKMLGVEMPKGGGSATTPSKATPEKAKTTPAKEKPSAAKDKSVTPSKEKGPATKDKSVTPSKEKASATKDKSATPSKDKTSSPPKEKVNTSSKEKTISPAKEKTRNPSGKGDKKASPSKDKSSSPKDKSSPKSSADKSDKKPSPPASKSPSEKRRKSSSSDRSSAASPAKASPGEPTKSTASSSSPSSQSPAKGKRKPSSSS